MGIIVSNLNNQRAKELDDELGDMVQTYPVLLMDNSFVTKSKMTTDEALIIKNGIIHRIYEKYGDRFSTDSVAVIRTRADINNAIKAQQDDTSTMVYCAIGIILLFFIVIWKAGNE